VVDARATFQRFMERREDAAQSYVSGEPEPLGGVVTRDHPATFFGPRGGHRTGAERVWSTYESDASAFSPGGETTFEILDMAAGDDVAYWVGFQRARVRFAGADPVAMDLRVTEVFRREDGEWKLVHRHADPLTTPS
jgi:ketosteroid isomerase-like protein